MDIRGQAEHDTIEHEAEINEAQDSPELLRRSLEEISVDSPRDIQAYSETGNDFHDEYQVLQPESDHPQHETLSDNEHVHENENRGSFTFYNWHATTSHAEGSVPTNEFTGEVDELETMVMNIQKLIEEQSVAIRQQRQEMELQHEMLFEIKQNLKSLQDQVDFVATVYKIPKDTKKDTNTLLELESQTANHAAIYIGLRFWLAWLWYATIDLFKKNRLIFETIIVLSLALFVVWGTLQPNFMLLESELLAPDVDNNRIDKLYALTNMQEEESKYGAAAAAAKLSEANNAVQLRSALESFPCVVLGVVKFAVPLMIVQNLGKIIAGLRRMAR